MHHAERMRSVVLSSQEALEVMPSLLVEEQLPPSMNLGMDWTFWGHFWAKIPKNGGQMRSKIGDFPGFYLRASGWAFMGPPRLP
ncbi:BQ5605_C010g06114 [Microbotryum silenes-dioicae]|uniref:BQ5605_C010g06114 protein n=1 Tax=Microbotryum silenes-dioicae TaxID=796604 RepID=A0A2X0MJT5_9BASI|nr:BQ5605_C010g06114 [Microbotryum silenes-dioicae]